MYKNPFPYSDDNLRYHTYSYYLKHKYRQKVCKVPLNAGFTCPNRDGTKGFGGCRFCSESGSGEFVKDPLLPLEQQYEEGIAQMHHKWPDALGIAYFQAYSNTYGTLEHIKEILEPFAAREEIAEISIATRPDCLNEEKIAYLSELSKRKPLSVEMGLQSAHDSTMERMNRGHSAGELYEKVAMLKEKNIRTTLHIINGLPNETPEMMLETARKVAELQVDGIKIHMLNILKSSALYQDYKKEPFELLSLEEYVDIVVSQLEVLPPEMVIERVTGDGMEEELIAPLWIKKKTVVRNEIAKLQLKRDSYQGKYYETGKH